MTEHWTHSTMTVSDPEAGELTFDVWGPPALGPALPVLALHGFPQHAGCWEPLAARLADAGVQLYAFDQRGYSAGARPDEIGAYRDDRLAADVLRVADALGIARFHLIGHDWGSHVAWVTAASYPQRVATLTAVSVPHPAAYGAAIKSDPDQASRSSYIKLFWKAGEAEQTLLADDAAWLRDSFGDLPAESYIERMREPGALTAALSWYRAMHPGSRDTPPVRVPTTYVFSDQDRALSESAARACEQFVDADYELVVLPGVDHWVPERATDELADAVLRRIRSV